MIFAYLIIIILYLIVIGSFVYGFNKVATFHLKDITPKTTFSVIIPFRNEAENLPVLLESIALLNYPKGMYEIIFVDDASEDESTGIIENVIDTISKKNENTGTNIRIIKNERHTDSPKKDAITSAINKSKYHWIVTTDADCILPKYWLDSFDEFIQNTQSKCVVAPVKYITKNRFLNRFQTLDILSLQGATIGGFGIQKPFLCNGANLAYKKKLFLKLNGFQGNTTIASGDDIFLLEKAVKAYPNQVNYLKCEQSIVCTKAQSSWSLLIRQRIRWASKAKAYNNWFSKLTGLIVLAMNGLIISTFTLMLFNEISPKVFLYILIIKFNIDFFLIYKSATFFNQKGVLKSFFFSFIIYPFFTVYIAFISLFRSYKWKGRVFKK
ncbi:glycosyltransferase [uncultured Algibacter sp.]|uniref:glycosyltransferase n=1 Tax=uncultured Algibacter sp. TaxID=298659 RepID=UPI00262C3F04|nr:glycosyltransferase [uncultured Algibacter sp.]